MLQAIRDKFTGVIAFLVIGAIGVTLVISFGNMSTDAISGNFAAEVNGVDIPLINYQRVMRNQLVRQQELFQGELPPALQQQLQRNVLENMVRNEVVKQYVRDSGYRIDDQRVTKLIRNQPAFQVGGQYSYDSYVAILNSQGFSPEGYEREQRTQMEVEQLQTGVVGSAFYTPAEYRRYIELLAEDRRAAIISFEPSALVDEVPVSAAELQTYYDENPAAYTLEESVTLEYVELLLVDVARDIRIDDVEVRDYYDANADRYVAQAQRRVSHILIIAEGDVDNAAAERTAADLRARIAAEESFEALAREFSNDPVSAAEGGSLGWAGPGDYPEAFEEALFALEVGQTSAPVRTEFGYHLIRLDEIRAGSQQPFDEMRAELADELRMQKATDKYYALADAIDDLALENSGSLDAVADDTGLTVRQVDVFSRSGGDPLGYSQALVDAVFSVAVLEDGENSPLIELADDRAVVVRVVEHRPAAQQAFAAVRDSVETAFRLEQAATKARGRGAAVLAGLQAGDSFESLAGQHTFDVPEVRQLTRTSGDIAPELLAAIFRAPNPGAGPAVNQGVELASGGYAVFRLAEVIPGRPDSIPQQQRDARKQELAQQDGGMAAAAIIANLRGTAKVIVAAGLFDLPEQF